MYDLLVVTVQLRKVEIKSAHVVFQCSGEENIMKLMLKLEDLILITKEANVRETRISQRN